MSRPNPYSRPPSPKQKRPEYFQDKRPSLTQQQREVADALIQFVIRRNGWVTSVPGALTLRVELPISTSQQTIDELNDLKFGIKPIGRGERLWWERPIPVDIFEIAINNLRRVIT